VAIVPVAASSFQRGLTSKRSELSFQRWRCFWFERRFYGHPLDRLDDGVVGFVRADQLDNVVDIGLGSFTEGIENDVPLFILFLKLSDISLQGAFSAVITVDIIGTVRLVDNATTFTSGLLSITLRSRISVRFQCQSRSWQIVMSTRP